MTLEETAVAFFSAIRSTIYFSLGHEQFAFKVDISISVRPEDADAAVTANAAVQAALTHANASVKPIKVSLQ